MPQTSPADKYTAWARKLLADTWGIQMVTTYIAFVEEDTVAVLTALEIKQMPKIWYLGELGVIARSGPAVLKVEALMQQGISFNYTSYNMKDAMVPAKQGEVRYGHDGTALHLNLLTDHNLAYMYTAELMRRTSLEQNERTRIAHVCCGQSSWDDREANGQMYKMRLLLT